MAKYLIITEVDDEQGRDKLKTKTEVYLDMDLKSFKAIKDILDKIKEELQPG